MTVNIFFMKLILFKSLLLIFFSSTTVAQTVSFYTAAHQDDWQLFMSSKTMFDRDNQHKLVFITLTAGDAGLGTGGKGNLPYYTSRENGAILSSKFLADINKPASVGKGEWVDMNDHKIYRYTYKNTINYFLRLPDGNPNGTGYEHTGRQSLQLTYDAQKTGNNKAIMAVDSSAKYAGLYDLVKTIQTILKKEMKGQLKAHLHVTDTDTAINVRDHSDHLTASKIFLEAASGIEPLAIYSYINYFSAKMPQNLSIKQVQDASALHACDVVGMTEGGYNSNWDALHNSWLTMDYYRIKKFAGADQPLILTSYNNKMLTPLISKVNTDSVKQKNFLTAAFETQVKEIIDVKVFDAAGNEHTAARISIPSSQAVSIPFSKSITKGKYYLYARSGYFEDLQEFEVD
jgi:hypothetical protein